MNDVGGGRGGISFTDLIKATVIAAPEGYTLLVLQPTTGHDSPHSHLIKLQTDSDNKVQRYKGDISGDTKVKKLHFERQKEMGR
jgi:hypothetical protein